MSTSITFNNTSYTIPSTGDVNWGDNVSSYLIAIAAGALQLSGGSFFLTAEVNFGPNFGLASLYYKTRTANLASTGQFRLARTDTIQWRNQANNGDLALAVDASNNLTFNGNTIVTGGTVTSITGTANQVIVSQPTGAVTLSLPQSIAATSTPSFAALNIAVPGANDPARITTQNGGNSYSFGTTNITGTGYWVLGTGTALVTDIADSAISVSSSRAIQLRSNQTTTAIDLVGGVQGVHIDNLLPLTTPTSNIGANAIPWGIFVTKAGVRFQETGAGTDSVTVTPPASITSSYDIVLPNAQGAAGSFPQNDGSGNLTWVVPTGSGTVTAGTAGRLTLYPASSDTVSDTYVQNANDIHVAIAAHAALASTRTYTIPEAGADASFVMTQGNQTLAGVKTFSAQDVHSAGISITGSTSNYLINAVESLASVNVIIGAENSSPTGVASANLNLTTNASSTGSPSVQFIVGSNVWSVGEDHQDSDAFKISSSAGLGSTVLARGDRTTTGFAIHGTNTNDSAAAGYVGEYVSSSATGVSVTTSITAVTSIALTAGDWDISAVVQGNGSNGNTFFQAFVSTTTASSAGTVQGYSAVYGACATASSSRGSACMPAIRASLTGNTTYFLNAQMSAATSNVDGSISARRVR